MLLAEALVGILTGKVGHTDLVFGVPSGFISRSAHAKLQVSMCSGYNLLPSLLTLSPPVLLRRYTLPYWSNPPFLIFDIRVLWIEYQSARISKIKYGLDHYGTEPFEQQQFGTAGIEGVNIQTDPHPDSI